MKGVTVHGEAGQDGNRERCSVEVIGNVRDGNIGFRAAIESGHIIEIVVTGDGMTVLQQQLHKFLYASPFSQ